MNRLVRSDPQGAAREKCPLCDTPIANAGSHVRTPELDGSYGDCVYFCIPSGRHVTRRAGWTEEVRRSLGVAARRLSRSEP